MNVRELKKVMDYVSFSAEEPVDTFEVEARVSGDTEWSVVNKIQVGTCTCDECGCEIPEETVVMCGGSCAAQ